VRDQPQIPEIDLQLPARRPVINRRGHLAAARPAPLGRATHAAISSWRAMRVQQMRPVREGSQH
jgi:hypothetical protein